MGFIITKGGKKHIFLLFAFPTVVMMKNKIVNHLDFILKQEYTDTIL